MPSPVQTFLRATLLSVLGFGASARADVVLSDLTATRYLLWVEGDDVYRAVCPGDAEYFDRDTCAGERVHTPLSLVQAIYRSTLAVTLSAAQRSQAQVLTKIKAIDQRIDAVLNVEPDAPRVTRAQLDAAERAYDAAHTAAQPYRDEVARLEIARGEAPNDREVLAQLGISRARLAGKEAAQGAALRTLDDLRAAYVGERGSADTDAFNELVRLSVQSGRDLQYWNTQIDHQLAELTGGEVLLTRLADKTFAWPVTTDPNALARRLERAYADAEREARSRHVRSAERYRVQFDVTDPRVVEAISCRVSSQSAHGMSIVFQKLSGNVIQREVHVDWSSASSGLFAVDFGGQGWTKKILIDGGFLNAPSPGRWDISYHYLSEPTGPVPEPFEPLNCTLTFAR